MSELRFKDGVRNVGLREYALIDDNITAEMIADNKHIIPELVSIEEDEKIRGLLIILNTMGGDVEAGLAIAELIASMKKHNLI